MSNLKKLALILAPLVLFTILPGLLSAQDDSGGKISATGCVKKGHGGEGYYLMGQDGKMYELWGKGIADHVNHTVTVTGMQAKMTPAQEEKKEASEKSEAGSATYVDMKVSNLKMVSDSCQ
jgi:hypothetical protein